MIRKDRGTSCSLEVYFLSFLSVVACSAVTSSMQMYKFEKLSGRQMPSAFATSTARSGIECCLKCIEQTKCDWANYNIASAACEFGTLTNFPFYTSLIKSDTAESWNAYTVDSTYWTLVFVGFAGIETDVYDAWMNGNDVTTDDTSCMSLEKTACSSHYRSSMVDNWSSLGIKQVRFSVFREGEEKQYVIFDGLGTDYVNWFSQDKILESSWTNLQHETYNYFSIEGFAPSRRFHMNLNHGGCENDKGYIAVVMSAYYPCQYDKQPSFPVILYAESAEPVQFEISSDVKLADFFTISIRAS